MTDALMDRIKAHRSAPDVYDPPTFDQMADRIEELERERDAALAAQDYTYIGKDMKPILARDLEDAKDEAEAKLAKAVERLETMADYNNYISYAIWATQNELGGKND
jgi:hypothetical protein